MTDAEGNVFAYTDVELMYGNPRNPHQLPHEFWSDFETSLDKVDDQEINNCFGKDGIDQIAVCARNRYMDLRIFLALHGVRISDIKKIYVLGMGFGNADLGYF